MSVVNGNGNGTMASGDLSNAIQDYLKEIYKLEEAGGRATTPHSPRRWACLRRRSTAMLKKLAALSLVEHSPLPRAVLTEAGEQAAIEVIRHHRLLEQYLAETLGLPIDLGARRGRPARARAVGGARGAHRRDARLPHP